MLLHFDNASVALNMLAWQYLDTSFKCRHIEKLLKKNRGTALLHKFSIFSKEKTTQLSPSSMLT